ncbi:MAG: pyridoxamine 5'-phosphate oxidase family protein [Frankiaceae bacterium]|jgi:hypothetical protein|nr:pyridoxamine 5'-phosphate oxidase family protein [Frankiaceae bacterium]
MDVLDAIDAELAAWLEDQPVFFVATAPSGASGHVNVSPKGQRGTFAVLGPLRVGYLDFTGSGTETIAHLRDNGRITLMFVAFDGRPNIVRLYGCGRHVRPGEAEFDGLRARFPRRESLGQRAVIVAELDRVQTSCGYGGPLMSYLGDRDVMDAWSRRKGEEGLIAYRAEANAASIDGLPGLDAE